ncbi:hypothetical protein LBMAG53_39450 [Planctomycetota bacterium]|nr:hypothetical protein LBMAG53_39450 [Planctomycetota bacterium]
MKPMNLFLNQQAHAMTKLTATMLDLTQPAVTRPTAKKPNSVRKGPWSLMAATVALAVGVASAADQTIDGTLTVGSGTGGGLVVNGLAPAPTPDAGTVRVSGGEIKAYGDIQTFSSIYGSGLLKANTSSAYAPWQLSKVNFVLTDYYRNVILLHEYYTSTLLDPNACVGEFVLQRGTTASSLRTSVIRVSSHSAYNTNHLAIASQGAAGTLATCSYGGKTYLALVVPYSASRFHSIEFSGYSISTAPERLKVVPYFDQNTSTVLNAEINSSLVILDANISQTYNYSTTTFTGGTAPGVPAATEVQLGGGSVAIGSTLKASGATTLSSSLGVTGATTLSSTLGVTGATTLTGAVAVNNTLAVTGATTLTGAATVSTVNATGPVTFDSGTASGTLPAAIANAKFRMASLNATNVEAESIAYGGSTALSLRLRAIGGTRAAPAATPLGQQFCRISANGHDGVGFQSNAGSYTMFAGSTWTASNRETGHYWEVTPSGSTVAIKQMQLSGVGLVVGGSTFVGTERLRVAGGTAPTTASATDVLVGAGKVAAGNGLTLTNGSSLEVARPDNARRGRLFTDTTATRLTSDSTGNDPLILESPGAAGRVDVQVAGQKRLSALSTGVVVIGSTVAYSPVATDLLQVKGGIYARKVTVEAATGWADTVFAADYRLPPLEEVAAHIAEKKHLPGIPSEAEIAAKGIDTADMLKRQMAKIEELTLYAIAAEKREAAAAERITAQSAELAAQSARNIAQSEELAAQVRENKQQSSELTAQSKELAALRARMAAIEAALLQLKP